MTEQKAEKILKQIDSVQTHQHTECWELSRQWSVLLPQRLNWTFTREQPGSSPGQTIRRWPENFRVAIHVWKRVMEKKKVKWKSRSVELCQVFVMLCGYGTGQQSRPAMCSVNFKRLNNKKEKNLPMWTLHTLDLKHFAGVRSKHYNHKHPCAQKKKNIRLMGTRGCKTSFEQIHTHTHGQIHDLLHAWADLTDRDWRRCSRYCVKLLFGFCHATGETACGKKSLSNLFHFALGCHNKNGPNL